MKNLREKCNQLVNKVNTQPLGRFDWAILGVMLVFTFVTMFYGDLVIIYNHSLTFLDSLFSMDMANFYVNTLARPYYGFGAVYYWTVYAVIAAWNLPVWILQKLFGINVFSVKCLLWSKLEIVFFFILTLWILEKILKEFGFTKEKCRFVQFMFTSSLLVFLPVIAIAQIDIITVFLMLVGIREYMNTDKITWKFLLVFSFAASLKIFALFVFIPLILLREKRILHVIWDFLMGLVFILLCLLPYAGRADYKESTSILNDVMVERMFTTTFPAGNTEIPAFITLLIIISIWAYVTKVESREQYFYYANWIALTVFADFFLFVFAHPYWIVLMVPYLTILIVTNTKRMKVNILLEFFMSVAVSVFYCTQFGTYMTHGTFVDLILPKFGLTPNNIGYNGLLDFVVQKDLKLYATALFAIFAACLVAFVILNGPWKKETTVDWEKEAAGELEFDHGMIYLRLFSIVVFIIGCIYVSYIN